MRKKKKTVSRRKISKKVGRAPDTRPDGANEVLKPVGEADEKIAVGAGGTLFVPREDISIDVDGAEELSLAELRTKRLRRTKRNEWFILDPNSEYPVHLTK